MKRPTKAEQRAIVSEAFQRGLGLGLSRAALRPRADLTHPAELPPAAAEVARRVADLRRFLFRPFDARRAVGGWLA